MQNTKPHAALLASPGMGHLIPVLELGKRLVTYHGFHVTLFVVATDASTTQSLLEEPYPDINIINLPLVDISGLVDPTASVVTKIVVMMRETLPSLRSAILALKSPPTALIVDLFGTEAFAVAEELNMLKYVFDTSTAWFLAITIYVPTIDKSVEDEHIIQKQPLRIPGCKPVRFDDTLGAYCLDRNDQTYIEYNRIGIEIPMADGILMNTWEDLEPTSIGALRDIQLLGRVAKVPVYPIGPLARPVGPPVPRNHVLNWLQKQPNESVIYELGVAVRPKTSATERVVFRAEIEMMVRKIMEDEEGFEMRKRVKELKYSGEKALSIKGGSSYNSLSQIAKHCELSLNFQKAKAQGA
ncbi:hypothetical protein SADUNF_Sadunf07G0026800 [Salix dunnii]|uniref:Uncharacterized protein n=1 Tax=Salix dunnii TaxID=1413687 RepID=A0A835JVR6_9ROSI|nr:hypothetical protein SADUNF_Sadunf07G0026800 [Salix dunnii]